MEQLSTAGISQQSSGEEFCGVLENNEWEREEISPHLEGLNNTNSETSLSQSEEDYSVLPHAHGASNPTAIQKRKILMAEDSHGIYQESDKDVLNTHNGVNELENPELDDFVSNNQEDIDNSSQSSGKGIQPQETNPFLDNGDTLLQLAKDEEPIIQEIEMTSPHVTHENVYAQTPEQSDVPNNLLEDDRQCRYDGSQEENTHPCQTPPMTPITPTEYVRQVSQPRSPSRKISQEKIHVFTYGLSGAGKSSVTQLLVNPGYGEDDQSNYVFVTKDESICMETTPSTFLKSLTQFRNAYRKQKERFHGVKHVVLMVIMKGRITDEIKTITKKEIEYLTNPGNPVILCVTGCDTDTDLQWWKQDGNYKEFEKYHLKFGRDRVVSGCAVNTSNIKEEFREDFEKRRQKFRRSLGRRIGEVAKPLLEPKSSLCPFL